MKEKMPYFNSEEKTYREPATKLNHYSSIENNIDDIMSSMEDDVSQIVEKLRNSIENKEYASILGIDSSGRVPALLMNKVINGIYQKDNSSSKVDIQFISGFRNKDLVEKNKLQEFFTQKLYLDIKANNKKILIVDDVLASGSSVKTIIEVLRDAKIDFDLAVMSYEDSDVPNPTRDNEKDIKHIEGYLGTPVYYGEYGGVSSIYGKPQMSGVKKTINSLHSISLNRKESPTETNDTPVVDIDIIQNPKILAYTREKITEVAEKIIEEF